jgi:hypothetical protein
VAQRSAGALQQEDDMMTRKQRVTWGVVVVVATALAAAGAVMASGSSVRSEDDLAIVKRAVAQSAAQATPATRAQGEEPRREAARPLRTSGKEPTWLKVRVTEKGTNRKKVTVNLPLALVRAVGDDWPRIDFACGDDRHARCGIKVSEVLAALESGQDLVEIDDEETFVRVWVE